MNSSSQPSAVSIGSFRFEVKTATALVSITSANGPWYKESVENRAARQIVDQQIEDDACGERNSRPISNRPCGRSVHRCRTLSRIIPASTLAKAPDRPESGEICVGDQQFAEGGERCDSEAGSKPKCGRA